MAKAESSDQIRAVMEDEAQETGYLYTRHMEGAYKKKHFAICMCFFCLNE